MIVQKTARQRAHVMVDEERQGIVDEGVEGAAAQGEPARGDTVMTLAVKTTVWRIIDGRPDTRQARDEVIDQA